MGRKKWGVVVILYFVCSFAVSVGSELGSVQEQTIATLEVLSEKIVPLFESLEKKQTNEEIRDHVGSKQEEVIELLAQQQEAIADADSMQEIHAIMEETKDRIILKTYDGITPRESLDELLTVPGGAKEQKLAVAAVLEVIGKQETRSLQLVTRKTSDEVEKMLRAFDSTVIVEELFRDGEDSYLQVTFAETSLLKQELIGELDEGILPERFLGYTIVKPEVYTIGQVALSGENTPALWAQTRWNTYAYHSFLRGLPKIRIGVVDTGVDPIHPDVAHAISKTISGYDFVNNDSDPFDDHMHGTHVAGTIAAAVNGGGVFGVNPSVEIVPLKICTKTGYCPSYAITNALVYAADKGIQVLNMSLGGAGTLLNNPTCAAIEYATNKGSIAIVAAGNANTTATSFIPAVCPHTITVGAVDKFLHRAPFSNYGAHVDISAPGVDIYSTIPGGGRKSLDGTSMATPHVSAAVATVLAKEGLMSSASMQQRLLSFTSPVTYESGKPIGPFLEYAALMQSIGVSGDTAFCGGIGCVGGTGGGVAIATGGVSIQGFSGISLEIVVGQEVFVLSGSHGSYLEKGSGGVVGFGNVKGGVIQLGGLRVMGLRPGYTLFAVRDAAGKKQQIAVRVKEQTIRIKPGERMLLGGNNERRQTKSVIASGLASTRLYYDSSWYVSAGVQEGYSTVTNRIYNKAELQDQEVVYTLRVGWTLATEPLVVSLDQPLLKVGQVGLLRITGGTPKYILKKSNQNIAFAQVRGAGVIQIASAQGEQVVFDDEDEEYEEPYIYSGEEIVSDDAGDVMVPLLSSEVLDEQIEIANTQESYTVYVIGLLPGESAITIVDTDGTQKSMTITIKETVLTGPLGTEKGWYYQDPNKLYEVRGISTEHPVIVSTRKSRNTYIYKMLRDGVTTLTLQLWNPFELKNQQMRYTIRSGTPSTMQVTASSGTIAVGDVAWVTILGGGGPYTVTKTNENLGLGYAESDLTTIATLPDEKKILIPQGNQLAPSSGGAQLSGLLSSGFVVSGRTDQDRAILDALDYSGSSLSVASVSSGTNSQTFRVVGLSSGTTTLTVKDVFGEIKTVPITVQPKQLVLTSAFVGGSFWAPYNPRNFFWFMNSKLLGTNTREWRSVESIRPTVPDIVGHLKRGYYAPYYLYGIANGSTVLEVDIYNPHERKQQKISFLVTTTGMSSTDLTKLLAEYVIKNKSDGPVSSINPGGGGFVSGSSVVTAPIIQIVKEQDTILGKVVQIQVSGGSSVYEVTLGKDVHFIDNPLQVAYLESGSIEDGDLLSENIENTGSGVDISSIVITETYTVPIVANRTYSLIVRNPTTISVKDIQKNTLATKPITTTETYSSFTYTVVKGSSMDLPVHPSYLLGSDNNTIMSIVKKTSGGYRLSFVGLGSTKLKVNYTNPITGRKTEVKIDVKVVEKGALTPPVSASPEIIEKTIYLDPTKEYALFLEDGKRYVINGNGLVSYFSPNEYLYVKNGGGLGVVTVGFTDQIRLLFSNELYLKGLRLIKGNGSNNIFEIYSETRKYFITLKYAKTTQKTFILGTEQDGGNIYIEESNISNEDRIGIIFSNALSEMDRTPGEVFGLFEIKFGEDPFLGEWNLKKSLYLRGMISETGGSLDLYGNTVSSSSLGNLLYGYLSEAAGIFDFAVGAAIGKEKQNYKIYYPELLANKRAEIDEKADMPRYNLGKRMFLTKSLTMFTESFKQSIVDGNILSSQLLSTDEEMKNICIGTFKKFVNGYSCACRKIFKKYNIDIDANGFFDDFIVYNALTHPYPIEIDGGFCDK